ncbi:hypothetical protein COCNU_03G005530 [Cocos nucifera]|uniref:pectinesterase n=1 Tax=Cocos nucifera TaxID=13894 RepID=A0A8K0I2U8_COCNU|nr:hypothetical protein COCNU_03G005530 [Cocos nucifera]
MSRRVLRVVADGSGDFRTVQEAIDAVPMSNRARTVIQVALGFYRLAVYVPKTKNFITLAASQPETTILSWDNANRINHHQSSRVIGTGTFGCGRTIVEGEDFIAENITFENSAPQGSGQALAIRVTADRPAFYNCRFLGWQVPIIPLLRQLGPVAYPVYCIKFAKSRSNCNHLELGIPILLHSS